MTPKGLLRLKQAASSLEDLAGGSFQSVIPDPAAGPDVRRLVLCSGKVYFDIVGHDERATATDVAVARLEQLYPFPVEAVATLVAGLPRLEEIVWAQEEPQNMGAWRSIRHRLDDAARTSSSRRGRHLRRTLVAGVAERGLSHRAPARAGSHRARGARRPRRLISASCALSPPQRQPLPLGGRAYVPP